MIEIKEKCYIYHPLFDLSFLNPTNQTSLADAEVVIMNWGVDKISDDVFLALIKDNKKIYIDLTYESMEISVLNHLNKFDDLSNFYYHCVPRNPPHQELQLMIEKTKAKRLNFVFDQYYISGFDRYKPYSIETVPKKKYLCYNGKTKPDRTLVVALLSYYNLLDQGYVTLYGETYTAPNFTPGKISDVYTLPLSDDIKQKVEIGLSKITLPLYIEEPIFSRELSHSFKYRIDFYNAVEFVLVTETRQFGFFVSEKTVKCIENNKKFIVSADPHYIKKLKRYYLEKYNRDISHLTDWCDLSYDDEVNIVKRIEKIIEIVKEHI